MNAAEHFASIVPTYMAHLLRDFPELTPLDAAAVFGNAGHESGGLATLQEIKPTVAGSKGGYGWMQWTGPRRRAYEAYCKRNNLNPASDQANYAYLFLELKGIEGTESGAIKKLLGASTLEAKVKAFELAFLRAGVKHYDQRLLWAERAMDAWRKSLQSGIPIPNKTAEPKPAPASVQPAGQAEADRGSFPLGPALLAVLVLLAAVAYFIFIKR